MIGSFGKVTFQASSSVVETFKSMKRTATASYSQHKVHGSRAVLEFTGFDAEKLTFEMTFSAFLGVNPKTEVDKLRKMLTDKKAYSLALGTDIYGKWVLQSMTDEIQYVYGDGKVLQCKVNVTLLGME